MLELSELDTSDVVANNSMNRERQLTGSNGYETDLRFNLVEYISHRLQQYERVVWVDLCCGEGRALLEAGQCFHKEGEQGRLRIIGVDLVSYFARWPHSLGWIERIVSPLREWSPTDPCDLITCVHGLHYVGDKLRVLQQCGRWLRENGIFMGNLDLANLRHARGTRLSRSLTQWWKDTNITYHARDRILRIDGYSEWCPPCEFVGARDDAGPNYTGQPAVNSFYRTNG